MECVIQCYPNPNPNTTRSNLPSHVLPVESNFRSRHQSKKDLDIINSLDLCPASLCGIGWVNSNIEERSESRCNLRLLFLFLGTHGLSLRSPGPRNLGFQRRSISPQFRSFKSSYRRHQPTQSGLWFPGPENNLRRRFLATMTCLPSRRDGNYEVSRGESPIPAS